MIARRASGTALAVLAVFGCGARSSLLDEARGRDAGATRDGPIGGGGGRLVLQPPVEVCGESTPGCDLYDGIEALVWTGERYALLFKQRGARDSSIYLALRMIDTEGRVSQSTIISGGARVAAGTMVWDGRQLAVFWKLDDSGDVRARAVGAKGELLGSARTVIPKTSDTVFLMDAAVARDGYALVVVFADRRARFVRLSPFPELERLGEAAALAWPSVGDLDWDFPYGPSALPSGGYGVLLNPRQAGGEDSLYLARLDEQGRSTGAPLLIHRADTVTGGQIVVDDGAGAWVGYNDDFDELYVVEVGAGGALQRRVRLRKGELMRPILAPTGRDGLAMLGSTNLWIGPGSFPATLVFETFLLATGERTARLIVDDRSAENGAILNKALARSGESFGLAWEPVVKEASAQRILFARVTRQQ